MNTAECVVLNPVFAAECDASMGPPREHGGMFDMRDVRILLRLSFNGAAA